MLKRIPVEAEAPVVLCLQCKVARSKRNAHNKNSVLQGVSPWLREMIRLPIESILSLYQDHSLHGCIEVEALFAV